jgi:hypothetical protein
VVQGVPLEKLVGGTGPSVENRNLKKETGTGIVGFEAI